MLVPSSFSCVRVKRRKIACKMILQPFFSLIFDNVSAKNSICDHKKALKYLHNGVVEMKINKVIHLINIIKLSVCIWWNFTLNLLKHLIFPTFLNELLFTSSDNIFQFPEWWVTWVSSLWVDADFFFFFIFTNVEVLLILFRKILIIKFSFLF